MEIFKDGESIQHPNGKAYIVCHQPDLHRYIIEFIDGQYGWEKDKSEDGPTLHKWKSKGRDRYWYALEEDISTLSDGEQAEVNNDSYTLI